MGRDGPTGLQRGLQLDGREPVDLSASEARKDVPQSLEDNGVERSLDGGGRDKVKTLNRRSRDAYNAYQREYMKKRRARLP